MQFSVSQLLKSTIGTARNYVVDETADIAGDGVCRRVQGEISLMHTDRGILARGTLHTEIEITCSRCLVPFSCPLTLDIEEEYFPAVDVVSGVPLSSSDEPGTFTTDEHHILDLTKAVCQYALMTTPMKPLCREDCAGLCPHCGRNLNQESCDCLSQQVNPRWSELIKLANKGKE